MIIWKVRSNSPHQAIARFDSATSRPFRWTTCCTRQKGIRRTHSRPGKSFLAKNKRVNNFSKTKVITWLQATNESGNFDMWEFPLRFSTSNFRRLPISSGISAEKVLLDLFIFHQLSHTLASCKIHQFFFFFFSLHLLALNLASFASGGCGWTGERCTNRIGWKHE